MAMMASWYCWTLCWIFLSKKGSKISCWILMCYWKNRDAIFIYQA